MRIRNIDNLSDHCDTDGEEEQVSFLRIECPEQAHFHASHEDSFYGVCVLARPEMEYGRLPFFVYVHLQSLLHLPIASAILHDKLQVINPSLIITMFMEYY